jgi:hypothetical protein
VTGRSWPMAEWTALAFANYPAEEVAIAVWRDLNRPSLTEMIARTNTLPR